MAYFFDKIINQNINDKNVWYLLFFRVLKQTNIFENFGSSLKFKTILKKMLLFKKENFDSLETNYGSTRMEHFWTSSVGCAKSFDWAWDKSSHFKKITALSFSHNVKKTSGPKVCHSRSQWG